MEGHRLAVIDLGSNTFHLLIVERNGSGGFHTVHKERIFTGLSEGGVETISPQSMHKGLQALHQFSSIISMSGVIRLSVIGTASLRRADNRCFFISQGEEILGTEIRIIDGLVEANYIFSGVMLLQEMQSGQKLIMDVGGGSTEFILVNEGKKVWANSYPVGVGVLHAMFHKSDPISPHEIGAINAFIESQSRDLAEIIQKYRPPMLVGASGSFEVLETMTGNKVSTDLPGRIEGDDFCKLYEKIIRANTTERENMPGLPTERVKLIVVGMILKKYIFDLVQPESILVSPYALKEGVISEMMDFQ